MCRSASNTRMSLDRTDDLILQGPVDVDEMIEIEQLCLRHPAVQAEIEKLKLPPGTTVCNDPWIYGADDPNETRRLFQCYMYIVEVDHPQNNHYSLPCKFSPVFDGITRELVRIDYLPSGVSSQVAPTQPWKPVKTVQYAHDLLDEPLRTDLKPYIVQQPEGPSFTVDGNVVSWQKWRFRVGFNNREGLVLYNVTFDGRNVLYRIAISEMTVPYGGECPPREETPFAVANVSRQTPADPTIASRPSTWATSASVSPRTSCLWDATVWAISSTLTATGPTPRATRCC